MKLTTLIALLALTTAVGAGAWLYTENVALQDRLAALENPMEADAAEGAAPGSPAALRGSRTRREVAELQRLTSALVERMSSMERAASEAPAAGAAVALDAGALAAKPAFGEAVREIVLDMAQNDVDFRARVGSDEPTKIGKNAAFAVVADTLKLDSSQEAQMSKDLQEIQQDLFATLAEERDDGLVPMELIAKAEELKEGDPKRAETFMKLFTLKVPGSEETYMQRAVKLGTSFRKKIDSYLRPAQLEILNSVEIDWFSVKFN